MEVELRRVHRETGATFVYVTHDQREALALSDRIVVFDQGRVEQVGAPDEIYRRPRRRSRRASSATRTSCRWTSSSRTTATRRFDSPVTSSGCRAGPLDEGPGWLVLRPEVVRLADTGDGSLRGVVRDLAFRGSGFSYLVEVSGLAEPLKAELSGRVRYAAPELSAATVGIAWDSERPSACFRGQSSD